MKIPTGNLSPYIQTTHKAQYKKIKNPIKNCQRSKCAFLHRRYRHGHKVQEKIVRIISSSVQFSHSVMSESLRPHELQHARPSCPSPTPRVYSNSCPSSRWCHPTISSSVVPFSFCPQSLLTSGSFFQWVNSSHEVAKVLEFQLQHQSFQWTPRTDLL